MNRRKCVGPVSKIGIGLSLVMIILLSSCSIQKSQPEEITIEVTREVTVEVTKVVTQVIYETVEVPVTVTPTSTPKFTATITQTPTNTATVTLTPTNTKEPGVGTEFYCGDKFIISVTEQPRKETRLYGEQALGQFWLLKIDITNLLNESYGLDEDDFVIQGELNGQKVEFNAGWDPTWEWVYHHYGQLIYPWDDIVAGLTASVGIGFDVNPNAENFKLVWFPRDNMFDDREDAYCEIVIPLN